MTAPPAEPAEQAPDGTVPQVSAQVSAQVSVYAEISVDEALRALAASTRDDVDGPMVRSMPDRPGPWPLWWWRLPAAVRYVRGWRGDLAWTASDGLILLDGGGRVAMSFATVDPATVTPATPATVTPATSAFREPAATVVRKPGLRLVPPPLAS